MIWVNEYIDPQYVAYQSRNRPEGRAALIPNQLIRHTFDHPDDTAIAPDGSLTGYQTPWPTHGSAETKKKINDFFTAFSQSRGRADWLVIDYEDYMSSWALTPAHAQALQLDPRSDTLKQQLGFDDFSVIFSTWKNPAYLDWNAHMHKLVTEALHEAVFEPVRQLFPDVKGANYGGYVITQEEIVPNRNGHLQHYYAHFGTHNNPWLYGRYGFVANQKLAGNKPYGDAPFAVFRWLLNRARSIRRSSDAPLTPWVSHKKWDNSFLKDTPYYEELIYHLVLTGVNEFLFWNPKLKASNYNTKFTTFGDDAQDQILDNCLAEVNERLGDEERWSTTLDLIAWDSPFVATGMRISEDWVLWRITAPPQVAKMRFHQSGETVDLTSTVGFWYRSKPGEQLQFDLIMKPQATPAAGPPGVEAVTHPPGSTPQP